MVLIRNELKKLGYKKSLFSLLLAIFILILLYALFTRYAYNELYGDDWRKSLLDTNKSITALLEDERTNSFLSKEMGELILINDYYLENNIDPSRPDCLRFLNESKDLAVFLFIACILISSTIITDEYDDGKIKILLLQPYKKWHFIAAKWVVVILINISLWMYFIVLSLSIGAVFFGTQLIPSVGLINGAIVQTNTISYLVLQFIALLVNSIAISIFAFVAANVLIKKTLSVAIGLCGYFFGGICKKVLSKLSWNFLKYEFFTLTSADSLISISARQLPWISLIISGYIILMFIGSCFIFSQRKGLCN
jgi:ABC-2 type transport system permease protein